MAKSKKQSIAIYERTRYFETHKCKWCEDVVDASECNYEMDLGWLCDQCTRYLESLDERIILIK